jgi:hypothetical protein
MKNNIFKHFFLAIATIFGLASCEDREIITVDNQTSPIVMDLSAESLFLDKNFPNNPALTITWSEAEYSIPTEVTYKVEVSSDESFSEPSLLTTIAGSQRSTTLSALQMNDASGKLGFLPDVPSKMYIRVTAYLGVAESLKVSSNITSLMVTPYVLTYPDFYLVGEASYVGWTPDKAQILNKKESLSYIYTYLENGKNFRFLGQLAWDGKNYALNTDGTKDENKYFKSWTDNLSKPDGDNENIKFTGATGVYKITIDAADSKQTIEVKASPIPDFDIPQVYLVGNVAGVNWVAENAVAMTKTGAGVFEIITTLPADAEFKFLGQQSFGALDWGNISAKGNSGFLGPKGDNDNIAFVGDGGSYKITVNIKAGIYTIVKQ